MRTNALRLALYTVSGRSGQGTEKWGIWSRKQFKLEVSTIIFHEVTVKTVLTNQDQLFVDIDFQDYP